MPRKHQCVICKKSSTLTVHLPPKSGWKVEFLAKLESYHVLQSPLGKYCRLCCLHFDKHSHKRYRPGEKPEPKASPSPSPSNSSKKRQSHPPPAREKNKNINADEEVESHPKSRENHLREVRSDIVAKYSAMTKEKLVNLLVRMIFIFINFCQSFL